MQCKCNLRLVATWQRRGTIHDILHFLTRFPSLSYVLAIFLCRLHGFAMASLILWSFTHFYMQNLINIYRYPDGSVKLRNPHIELMDQDILYHIALGSESHDLVEMFGDVKVLLKYLKIQTKRHNFSVLSLSAWAARRNEWKISHISSWRKSVTNYPPGLHWWISVSIHTGTACTKWGR